MSDDPPAPVDTVAPLCDAMFEKTARYVEQEVESKRLSCHHHHHILACLGALTRNLRLWLWARADTCSEYAVLQKMNTLAASEYEAMCNQLKQTNTQADELKQSCTILAWAASFCRCLGSSYSALRRIPSALCGAD